MKKLDKSIRQIIRVNHAGEFGAQEIYNSQIKFLKNIRLKKKYKKFPTRKKFILIILTNKFLNIG